MRVIDNSLNLDFKLHETECYKTMPTYNYWCGWWNEEPRNLVEQVIKDLWQDLNINFSDYGGFEYWNRYLTGNVTGSLEWHQDTGEYHYKDKTYWISDKSLVYYPYVSKDCIGGYLEIGNYYKRGTLEDASKASRDIDYNMVERIRPITNRYVLIDSAQLHKVSPVYRGERHWLAIALWIETPKFFIECENWNGFGGDTMTKTTWKSKFNKLLCQ